MDFLNIYILWFLSGFVDFLIIKFYVKVDIDFLTIIVAGPLGLIATISMLL